MRSRADIISDIQRELSRRGLYDGPVDGVLGPKTDSAIRDFEMSAKLKVTGEPSEDVLRGQLQQSINSHPTLVTLGIGINDMGHGLTAERFARNYEEIIRRLKEETSATIVVTNIPDISYAPVVPVSARDETRRRVQSFNEKIEAIAKKYELLIVDAYSETQAIIPTHPEFFSEDGFHPSDAGYEYWAETMWPTVKVAIER